MKNNKYFENMSIWKIFAMAIFIYIIVSLTSYVSDKTNIFVGSLVPVFALILYYVCEYFLGRRSR